MKIAVIGASGLLGSAVCREVLARGYRLLAYSNKVWKNPKDNFQTTSLPLDKFDPVIRELFDQWPDALINCAAISSPIWLIKIPKEQRSSMCRQPED